MTEEAPQDSISPLPAPEPERFPFWTFVDAALIAGMTIPCMALGLVAMKGVFWLLRLHPSLAVAQILPAQILGYLLVFASIAAMFQLQYDKPFWRSIGWLRSPVGPAWLAIAGAGTAIAVAIAASLLHTPESANAMTELMRDRTSLLLMTVFGVGIAPVAEELAFRGFLQPLLAQRWGVVAGIAGAAIPFGFLHFHEYGNSWRHAVVISLAGASFGAMRHFTGSTRSAAGMHAAYNAFLFLALFSSRKDLPHLW